MLVKRWVTPGAVVLVIAISGMSSVPSAVLMTLALGLQREHSHDYPGDLRGHTRPECNNSRNTYPQAAPNTCQMINSATISSMAKIASRPMRFIRLALDTGAQLR